MRDCTSSSITGKNTFFRWAFSGIFLSLIYCLAPGEELSLISKQESIDIISEHPLPSIGSFDSNNPNNSADDQSFILLSIRSGSNILTGRFYPPNNRKEDRNATDTDTAANMTTTTLLPPPLIIMGHGLGLVQDAELAPFVKNYQNEGFAVVTFDYASFGWSQGWPRHQVIPNHRIADWHAVLAYVRSELPVNTVDLSRIGLWGASLGGGHVLSVAAQDPDIAAVVALVPVMKTGLEGFMGTILNDPVHALLGLAKLCCALLKWGINAFFEIIVDAIMGDSAETYFSTMSSSRLYVPLHGPPGSAAVMQNPGDTEGYGRLVQNLPSGIRWKNLVSISSILPLLIYRPYNSVNRVQSPVLLLPAENDTLCPLSSAQEGAKRMSLSANHSTELTILTGLSHFDVFQGEGLNKVLEESTKFFTKMLLKTQ